MSIQIKKTSQMEMPSLVLTIYGNGGVGKSTLAASAPSPVFIDAEEGTKAFGARGIDVAVANVKTWADVQEAWGLIRESDYETIVIDPIGVFLNLLIEQEKKGGNMSIQKWGFVKDKMRKFIWTAKDSGKHVIFVAHEKEQQDEQSILRRPDLAANLAQELVNMCDVVGHMRIDDKGVRCLLVQPENKYVAKDRFDALDHIEKNPTVAKIIEKVHKAYTDAPFKGNEFSKKK